MSNRSRHRSTDYTGCWTCKARKVRCDERPSACRNCTKRGIVCGGYDLKLQWMIDWPLLTDVHPGSSSQGRRRIKSDRTYGLKYSMKDINRLLLQIDNLAQDSSSVFEGPFSVLSVQIDKLENKNISPVPLNSSASPLVEAAEAQDVGYTTCYATLASFDYDSSSIYEQSDVDPSGTWSSPLDMSFCQDSDPINDPENLKSYQEATDDKRKTAEKDEKASATPSDGSHSAYSDVIQVARWSASNPSSSTPKIATSTLYIEPLPIQHIRSSLFGDVNNDVLMQHYTTNLADILQPLPHRQNPYRGLYVPAALQAALIHVSNPTASEARPHTALYHALLACSAFHLWNCNKAHDRYRTVAIQHRWHALHSLQAVLDCSTPKSDYKILMMAMLALVTTGTMSEEDNDTLVHLHGTMKLRNLRKGWKMVSRETRQLVEMCTFLSLLARTLLSKTSPLNLIGLDDDTFDDEEGTVQIIISATCYEFMYGITSSTALALQEICHLANMVAKFNSGQETLDIPDHILESCESLGDRLMCWNLDTSRSSSILEGEELTIFNNHAKAWHHSVLIYYYNRIQGFHATDLVSEVECVAQHMHSIEDIKSRSNSRKTKMMAPITWPMFIASCNTTSSNREVCQRWWKRLQRYGIANIQRQWDVVQGIWEKADGIQEDGGTAKAWMDLYYELGVDVLPI